MTPSVKRFARRSRMRNDGTRERGAASGAWAAAAVVLALGALLFGFTAHVRLNEMEAEVARLSSATTTVPVGEPRVATDEGLGLGVGADSEQAGSASAGTAQAGSGDSAPSDDDRLAVVRAFTTVYDASQPLSERLLSVDDPSGVDLALQAIEAGPNGELVKQVVVSVNDVKFPTANSATVIYTIVVPGADPVPGRNGGAKLIDGAWKVTRATVCGDLAAVGGSC
ncbi:MAG: hypothetical protein M9952_08960 [Microthrixaceae bacterium]|nr:hypothetical protein [Microthrixaceae bacterium]